MAKSYVRDTSGLKRYHEAMREAKTVGGEYADYVKRYYRTSKGLRVGSGKRRGGVSLKGIRVFTYDEFKVNMATGKTTVRGLIKEQFGLLDSDLAKLWKKALKQGHFDVSLQRIMAKQLSTKEWGVIDDIYFKLQHEGWNGIKGGLSSEAAALTISQYFFGS